MRWLMFVTLTCAGLIAQNPQNAPPKSKRNMSTSIPNTDDIEALVRQLVVVGSGTKGEFETTSQFEARQSSVQTDKQYAFVYVWDALSNKSYSTYDADKQIVTVNMKMSRKSFSSDGDHTPHITVLIKRALRRTGHHVGQNSYGAKVVVRSEVFDDFGIVISEEAASWLLTFASVSPDEAKLDTKEMKYLQKRF